MGSWAKTRAGGHALGPVRRTGRARRGVLEHPVPDHRGGDARPAGQHHGAVRAAVASGHHDLGGERLLKVPPGLVQQRLDVRGRQAEDQTQIDLVPAVQLEGLKLIGGQARHRVPGQQPRIGILPLRLDGWLVCVAGRNRGTQTTFGPRQAVKPRAEPFIANQAPGMRGGDDQRIAHRDLGVFAIPQQASSRS